MAAVGTRRIADRARRLRAVFALLGAALPVALLSQGFILEKGLDLALEMRLAAVWGVSARRDMYLIASIALLPAGIMQMVAIPLIVDLQRRGARAAARRQADSLTFTSALLTALAAALALAIWRLSGGGASTPAGEMLAATLAFGLAGVAMSAVVVAAAERIVAGDYGLVSLRMPAMRAAMLGAAFVVPLGVAAPALGAASGAVLLALAVGGRAEPWRWVGRPRLAGLGAALGMFAMNAYPIVPRLLVERPVLGALADGTLARLDFAEKTTVILGLAGFAIGGVAATALGRDAGAYRRRALLVVLLLTPVALATAVFAAPIVSLLFQRGAFGASDSDAVAELARWLAPSVPLVAGLPLLVPGVRAAGALGRGVALVAAALLVHAGVAFYAHETGDVLPLTIAFDLEYLVLFAGFFTLARQA